MSHLICNPEVLCIVCLSLYSVYRFLSDFFHNRKIGLTRMGKRTDTENDDKTCLVCWQAMTEGAWTVVVACGDNYHARCLYKWLNTPERGAKCPGCNCNFDELAEVSSRAFFSLCAVPSLKSQH